MGIPFTVFVDPFLAHIKAIPFVLGTRTPEAAWSLMRSRITWDATVFVETADGETEFRCTRINELKYSTIDYLVQLIEGDIKPENVFIFSLYITPHWGEYLAEKGFNFVDLGGNSRLKIGDSYYHMVLGKKRVKPPESKQGIRSQGYRVIFTLLAEPKLVASSVRNIASNAGVSKTAVADRLQILEQDGYLQSDKNTRQIVAYDKLLTHWLEGYKETVEPKLTIARFKTAESDPVEREKIYPEIFMESDIKWAWGGLTASNKMTGGYRDNSTTIHVESFYMENFASLRAMPDESGDLVIMRMAGPISMKGAVKNTMHPLLIYTQLITSDDEKARDAAADIYDRYIQRKVEGE